MGYGCHCDLRLLVVKQSDASDLREGMALLLNSVTVTVGIWLENKERPQGLLTVGSIHSSTMPQGLRLDWNPRYPPPCSLCRMWHLCIGEYIAPVVLHNNMLYISVRLFIKHDVGTSN